MPLTRRYIQYIRPVKKICRLCNYLELFQQLAIVILFCTVTLYDWLKASRSLFSRPIRRQNALTPALMRFPALGTRKMYLHPFLIASLNFLSLCKSDTINTTVLHNCLSFRVSGRRESIFSECKMIGRSFN